MNIRDDYHWDNSGVAGMSTLAEHKDSIIVGITAQQDNVLPSDKNERKGIALVSGVLDYFPNALAEVARVSAQGNIQHNLNEGTLQWARDKSTDHADCIVRHLVDRGKRDTDGQRHSSKAAWRALALLEEELEAEGMLPGRASVFPTNAKYRVPQPGDIIAFK